MKYFSLLFIALVFAGCSSNTLTVTGNTKGITDATITLSVGQTLAGVNVKDGKFDIKNIKLDYPDYGTITFSEPGKVDHNFEIYLEPGAYAVTFNKNTLDTYPAITSKSAIQNQLSDYHKTLEATERALTQKVKTLDDKYKKALKSYGWADSLTTMSNRAEAERAKLGDAGRLALMTYVTAHPGNEIASHLMQRMAFELKAAAYYAVFQKFSSSQKNSDEGKDISERLIALIRLSPGAQAPAIAGTMPNGKPFDLKALNKKLILIEFWRASSVNSRINHQTMVTNPPAFMTNKDLGIVSVSFDKKRDWWLGSMRDDKVSWTQVSDLRGNDSPNKTNWAVTTTPTYYLLDGAGRILEPDLPFNEITTMVDKHLKQTKQ